MYDKHSYKHVHMRHLSYFLLLTFKFPLILIEYCYDDYYELEVFWLIKKEMDELG